MPDSCVLLEAFKQFMDPPTKAVDLVAESQESSSKAKDMLARMCKRRKEREAAEAAASGVGPKAEPDKPSPPKLAKVPKVPKTAVKERSSPAKTPKAPKTPKTPKTPKATEPAPSPPKTESKPPKTESKPPKALIPTLGPVRNQTALTTSMVFYTTDASLTDRKLRIPLSNLRAITKGLDFFTVDVPDSIRILKLHTDTQGSASVILSVGNTHELRDVHDVKFYQSLNNEKMIVEFLLGDMQVCDGGELDGELKDINIFFGNLPATR